jgi:hypothetical protein
MEMDFFIGSPFYGYTGMKINGSVQRHGTWKEAVEGPQIQRAACEVNTSWGLGSGH